MNSILFILYTQTRRKIELEKVLKKNLYVLCYEEGSVISRQNNLEKQLLTCLNMLAVAGRQAVTRRSLKH
jgi:hypothetical protein